MMFNGIEVIIGGLGTLIGIGGGYLILSAFFAGIQHLSKPRILDVEESPQKTLDN